MPLWMNRTGKDVQEAKGESTMAKSGYPKEVREEIKAAIAEIKALDVDGVRAGLAEFDSEVVGELPEKNLSLTFARQALQFLTQKKILESHSLAETDSVIKRREKVFELPRQNKGDAPGSPGRKRMTTNGVFQLEVAEGQSIGREGSAKHGIMSALQAHGGTFTYELFTSVVGETLKWNAESKSFDSSTRFPDLAAATRAWFSELKNKSKLIVLVSNGEEAAA